MTNGMSSVERRSRITVPTRCNPLAKLIYAEMARQHVTYAELTRRSGVLETTYKSWRKEKGVGLDTGAAALGALGWALLPMPRHDRLPPAIAARLAALEAAWSGEVPLFHYLIAGACGVPIPVETRLQRCIRHAGSVMAEAA